ncbi:hypothetical protein HKCCE3408_14705 [Rhodobacterales bacterium HKCCE3408]|nr:hypothetical protein [Rhodobacterales bacterium HKCCE3408]
MMHTTKIATCCYCGSRTVLELTARGGHELACGSCGAPLHVMKALKQTSERAAGPRRPEPRHRPDLAGPARRRKPKKSRKSGWKRAMEEVFDVLDDIFD